MKKTMKIAELVSKVKVGGSTYYLKDGDFPARVIKHSNVSDAGIIDLASVESAMIRNSPRTAENMLEPGDILISGRSSRPKIALVPEDARNYYFSSEFFALTVNTDIISPEILAAYLSSRPVQEYLTGKSGGRMLSIIAKDDLLGLEITVPEMKEQNLLTELTELITEKYAIIEQEKRSLETLKESLFAELYPDGGEKC